MGKRFEDWNISASVIFTRCFHVVITVGIVTVMLSKGTVLRIHLDNQEFLQPVLYIGCAFISLVLYFTVACMDPGYVKRGDHDVKEIKLILDDDDDEDDESLFEMSKRNEDSWNIEMNKRNDSEKTKILENEISSNGRSSNCFNLEPHERCGLCGLQKPLRAKHCRDCKHCVRRFDHHCPWITNCVGERNHKWFYIFLVVTLCMLGWSFYISTTGYGRDKLSASWLEDNILLILADVIMGILILVVGSLLCIHTYLMATNHTTWETMSKHRISYLKELKESAGNPFDLGLCRNMSTFFCYFRPFNWNVVYSKVKSSHRYDGSESESNEEFCEINIQ